MGEAIDIEASVVTMTTPADPERDAAQELVERVLEQKKLWVASWHPQLVDPSGAMIEEFPPDTVGCSPGSCQLKVGDRVVAKFVIRFREEPIGCDIEADWPKRKPEEESANLTKVLYEEHAGRVDYAVEELGLEDTAQNVEEMKRRLHARFGFRFSFVRA